MSFQTGLARTGIRTCDHAVKSALQSTVKGMVSGRCKRIGRRAEHMKRAVLAEPLVTTPAKENHSLNDLNQHIREGHYESSLVQQQAAKLDAEQPSLTSQLEGWPVQERADVVVVGCGPAGLVLAAELSKIGVKVALLGLDRPFVNNYGVWVDEFAQLGLEHTLDCKWEDALCYFGEGEEVRVGRGYGRVDRRLLRNQLIQNCRDAGVKYLDREVSSFDVVEDGRSTLVTCTDGTVLRSRLVTLAAGAAAGKFLKYEEDAPVVAAQTAYGIEAEVVGYTDSYDPNLMTFMDFRRHHSGLWGGMAPKLQPGLHPNGSDGLWGTHLEVPSFLYAMPLGGNRVFLEETCLVAKPALPFAVLKRRLERRLEAMGVKVEKVHEEEWSYIPVGGPLPLAGQPVTAFGAAANLVHPATGFSISRSIREAPHMASSIAAVLREDLPVSETSSRVWESLWPQEKRRQASFHVFGMELLANLDLKATNEFFSTFFSLPDFYWRGFLASSLSSIQLIAFALLTFVLAPWGIKAKLMSHLFTDPAGSYLLKHYLAPWEEGPQDQQVAAMAAVAITVLATDDSLRSFIMSMSL